MRHYLKNRSLLRINTHKALLLTMTFFSVSYSTVSMASLVLNTCGGEYTLTENIYNNGLEQACLLLQNQSNTGTLTPVTNVSDYQLEYTFVDPDVSGTVSLDNSVPPVLTTETQDSYHTIGTGGQSTDFSSLSARAAPSGTGNFYFSVKLPSVNEHTELVSLAVCSVKNPSDCASLNEVNVQILPTPIYDAEDITLDAHQAVVSPDNSTITQKFDVTASKNSELLENQIHSMTAYMNNSQKLPSSYLTYQTVYLEDSANGSDYKIPWYTSSVSFDDQTNTISVQAQGQKFKCSLTAGTGIPCSDTKNSGSLIYQWPLSGPGTYPRIAGPAPVSGSGYNNIYAKISTASASYQGAFDNVTPNRILSVQLVGTDQYGNKFDVIKNVQVCRVSRDPDGQENSSQLTVQEGAQLLVGPSNGDLQC